MSTKTAKVYFSDGDIDRLDKILADRSAEGVTKLTKKQVVLRLIPRVKEMLEKGFALPEITSILVESGFPVSRATIHATIVSAEKQTKKPKTAKASAKTGHEISKDASNTAKTTNSPDVQGGALDRAKAATFQTTASANPESDFNDPDA